jgi:hypothetical protein
VVSTAAATAREEGGVKPFTELRSDIHALASAIEALVRAEGPQTIREVFKRLPSYIEFTEGDLRNSMSRAAEQMWQTEVRNLSRNQNPGPPYRRYRAIENCTLVYEHGIFALSPAKPWAGQYHGATAERHASQKAGAMSAAKKEKPENEQPSPKTQVGRALPTNVKALEEQRVVKRTYTLTDEIEECLLASYDAHEFRALLGSDPPVNGSPFIDDVCAAQWIQKKGIELGKRQIEAANLAELCIKLRVAERRFNISREQRARAS